ncbi:AraC family transcriptional regulator [Luteipulveratus sp. YIM 133132]|uniref:helix-turn-helix domain-containing protein n=1 Tax=Luteipulveratus flavus TaxID=3031728 RepID=UPI0023AE7BE0|nr:AraC family transcriptional regulator [Luteipulveratus sp. YIM 133132]MDE9367666.1 AraC family transcriptional regulator [Luteipulveratus sp. YIM 133132]
MSTAQDTFREFLEVLTDALDEHDASAEDLAGRLYLSRFHLDRLVSSVAGEPPARLRRRLLLERAAYRLATTDLAIIDVAVEAGYASHEAFTRAFERGFGRPPSRWRIRPDRFTVDAPSGAHFHPPGSIRLPAPTKVSSMDLLIRMVEHHVWLTEQMIDRAARLPDAALDEAIDYGLDDDPEVMTIRRLLSRLVGQMDMWNSALAHQEYDFGIETHESIASLRSRCAEQSGVYLDHVRRTVSEGRLEDTFIDSTCTPAAVFTYGGMIAHVLTFAAHRRTMVVRALDAHGITDLGWGDPMRWVAEPA